MLSVCQTCFVSTVRSASQFWLASWYFSRRDAYLSLSARSCDDTLSTLSSSRNTRACKRVFNAQARGSVCVCVCLCMCV